MTSAVDLRTIHPKLFASMCALKARRCSVAVDKASIALENARLSARGSIRRSHDVITWMVKLQILKSSSGLDPASVLRRWNDSATKESQVLGSKRSCCLMLLDKAPEAAVQELINHVSEVGPENTCFLDDAFANKKLMPGQRAVNKF